MSQPRRRAEARTTPAERTAPAGPEADLAGLATTRTNLLARQTTLAAEVEAAVAHRRTVLIENGSAAAVADAERACREVEGTAFGVADALAEVDRRIAAAEARIEAERTAAAVEAAAAGLERDAAAIERAAIGLVRALAEVAKARTVLVGAISGEAAAQFDRSGDRRPGPAEIGDDFLARGFTHIAPRLDVHVQLRPWSLYSYHGAVEGADPGEVAAEFADRLRDVAEQVRRGEVEPILPVGHDAVPEPTITVPETEIHVIAPFFYLDALGHRRMVTSPVTSVPAPVAERAVEAGLAALEETPEWRRARMRDAGPASATVDQRVRWEDCADLGFDLRAWRTERLAEAA